ncbi:MAG: family 16 glycosylhydrolase [Clostridia bacterium]|nr:family 16 glycosylhydrolase [Clostridia bacterium]
MQKIFEFLHLAWRQQDAVYRVGRLFSALFSGGFSFKKLVAVAVAFAEMFGCVLFDLPLTPSGQELNLDGYSLVFFDDFEGEALNTDAWYHRGQGPRRNGANCESQVKVEDGNLVITCEYLEDGAYGAGWYAAAISLFETYNRGYFEIRCKCNDGGEFWSAFWIQADHPYDHELSKGGVGGAELDIFEAPYGGKTNSSLRNSVTQTIHCNGGDDDPDRLDSRMLGVFKGNNIYEEYNTYGLEWTEDEYIFYINGVETARSSFSKGVSQENEHVIVSLEIPDEITHEKDFTSQFIVDYVKIYQK